MQHGPRGRASTPWAPEVWAWGASRAYGHTDPSAVPNAPTTIKVLSGKAIVQVRGCSDNDQRQRRTVVHTLHSCC